MQREQGLARQGPVAKIEVEDVLIEDQTALSRREQDQQGGLVASDCQRISSSDPKIVTGSKVIGTKSLSARLCLPKSLNLM